MCGQPFSKNQTYDSVSFRPVYQDLTGEQTYRLVYERPSCS